MKSIPEDLPSGPFTRAQALAVGVSRKMLEGRRFVAVYRGVWRRREHEMTAYDWVIAARLALPDHAKLTGISRIQQLGLDFGPRLPVRFVVEGDLHLAFENVFVHRTKLLAPTDDCGITPAGAFIAYCARARVIDAIKVGDWLLFHGHITVDEVRSLALAAPWRDGAHESLWILDHLDSRSRSLKESETRSVLRFAGLPCPQVNVAVDVGEDVVVIVDMVYGAQELGDQVLGIEYEGSHHQEDRQQYHSDLDRYALMRRAGITYVQVTKEKLLRPKTLVGEVYRALLACRLPCDPPSFGEYWRQLFLPISIAVGPRRDRIAGRAVG